ncbi:regulator of chromosome condensation 1/beta-lactamase-inhibitor protein II [Microdochium trichocladiopsis]|uniref:Regulator of chromosome condensation 1/beta-lactamase-inhibitor protein II n=1 Tax=Microdochium trichocladiopsis TaxID=1682393 RepID=A0A9P8Y239_9PEZI|nr:regulator of chromosome condensation 1/beta-lactamase-inhibitor protein II [Microdochium trichocladiopsis]KAH7029039.1 regulator of chromosome condensation 1/beta-lactamase-inhibitor protein II [Microdochium trichocladiopsis]
MNPCSRRLISSRRQAPPEPQPAPRKRLPVAKVLAGFILTVVAGSAVALYPELTKEPVKPQEAVVTYEKKRPVARSKEDNRDIISSQHLQVKQSWEHPGVYLWGSNTGRVAAPDSKETVIKTPRRLTYFDDQLLRDIKLDRDFGAAVTEKGDLVQWGLGFSNTDPQPVTTLKGKDLVKIGISRDRLIALGKNGSVYSIPVTNSDQATGSKPQQSSWSLWTSSSPISYRTIQPKNLGRGETVTDIKSGLDHGLLLTSAGRVFSFASSTTDFPAKGQLGIPGLNWASRPAGAFDQPHEIDMLKGFKVSQIAAGDNHSLALSKDGKVFVWGDNTSGQLGFETENEIPYVDGPIPLPFSKLYAGTKQKPVVTSIAAGGNNSYFTIDATRMLGQNEEPGDVANIGEVTADTWACGSGIFGGLGNGRWTHVSLGPTKIKTLSGLREWDENTNSVIPIRLARLSAGSTHAAAVMNNVTYLDSSDKKSMNDTNWGADIVWWGGNEHYQLGTGRRNNVATPVYIQPLDGGAGDAEKGRKGEEHRFQITPRRTVRLGEDGKGRKVSVEQRVECGRHVTAVYSGA